MDNLLNGDITGYIEKLSSSAGTPGGGNAIGLVNSFACGLMLMSMRIAILKKNPQDADILDFERQIETIQKRSLELAEKDSIKFKEVLSVWKEGGAKLENALRESAIISMEISRQALKLIEIISSQDLKRYVNIITDVGISAEFAGACFRGGIMNYKINAKGIKNSGAIEGLNEEITSMDERFQYLSKKVMDILKGLI
jgi:formiminotetrahydrofolate cyclodeaminase